MADRRSRRPATNSTVGSPNALTASAKVLGPPTRASIPRPESWQAEAWGYYDSIGEVRFGASWFANALSRVRLSLAVRGQAGQEPDLLDPDDPRNDYVERLAGGETGQSQLLAAFAPHLSVPGIAYLVGTEDDAHGETWRVLSYDEIRSTDDAYEVRTGETRWVPLPANSLPVQVWRPHARFHWQPDSPMRPLLPVLRELSLLTAHVEATATSRLAGAGVFAIPAEATFPISERNADADDPFLAELMDAMLTPIADREAASAVVPLLMRVPGEHLDKVQHITFDTPFDDKALTLREEAIRRYANGMDIPAEVLLGMGDANHWTAWQIEEGAVKLHVVPMLETIVQALTIGWWRPLAAAAAAMGEPIADADDLIVWYDLAGLVVRPDRSGDARELYALDILGAKATLREAGFTDEDAPTEDETLRKVVLGIIGGAPTLAPLLLPLIGIDLPVPPDAEPLPSGGGTQAGPASPAAADQPADGPPDRPAQADAPTGPDDGPDAVAASSAIVEAGLVAAVEGQVWRALERAGNKLRNLGRSAGQDLTDVPPDEAYLHVDATCLTGLDDLLAGAWDRLPALAARYGQDPDHLRDVVDGYTRTILAARRPHTYALLADTLAG